MKRILLTCACILLGFGALHAQRKPGMSMQVFADAVNHWRMTHDEGSHARYAPEQYREIADNMIAYQNADGGWPKNIDWQAIVDPDSLLSTLNERKRSSTLDNRNIYSQVEYLSEVYTLTGEKRYRRSAERGIEYILTNQYSNGGWRGADVDAITYNDGVMAGVLFTWSRILGGDEAFGWIRGSLRKRIRHSWEAGLALILKTQYVQNGVKTVWAQQHDHTTLQPVKARAYELPGLTAGESAQVVALLMSIEDPSPEVIDAVKCAVAWFEKTRILGKRIVTVPMPDGHPEDPAIKKDRVLVDDPDAPGLWPRYCELEDNRPFFCNRDGVKVYSLEEVWPERRTGYGWYGEWGAGILKRYPEWLKRIESKR